MKYVSDDNLKQYDSLIKKYINDYQFAYGVEWESSQSSTVLKRIGNLELHKTLPIQSSFRGCIAKDSQIQYYLNENDWRFKQNPNYINATLNVNNSVYTITNSIFDTLQYEDQYLKINNIICHITNIENGTATIVPESNIEAGEYEIELGAVLNGYDGLVQVETPSFYLWSETEGTKKRVYVSVYRYVPYSLEVPRLLIDAYRCTVLNTVPENMGYLSTLPVNSLLSVVNKNAYCRGGMNNSDYDKYVNDDPLRSHLCKSRTNISRTNFRSYAKLTNRELLNYEYYKAIFYWLYIIEYANLNCQLSYNSQLTSDGFRQGGLGLGITTLNYHENWIPLLGYATTVIPCGFGNSLGNNTGIINIPTKTFISKSNNYYINQWQKLNCTYSQNSTTHSVTIKSVISSDKILDNTGTYYGLGIYTFNVQGLEEGQQLIFKVNNNVLGIIDSNGDFDINFSSDYRGARRIYTNFTGTCNITITTSTIPENSEYECTINNMDMPRWRGFDNPFGDIYTILDGINIFQESLGSSTKKVYCCTENNFYTDSKDDLKNYRYKGEQIRKDGYIKDILFGEEGDIIPINVNGSTMIYLCDYAYGSANNINVMTLIVGGAAYYSVLAGLALFSSSLSASSPYVDCGVRSMKKLN